MNLKKYLYKETTAGFQINIFLKLYLNREIYQSEIIHFENLALCENFSKGRLAIGHLISTL